MLALVSCSKRKLSHRAPARELYRESTLFRYASDYAQQRCDTWRILSAKHGLVHPDMLLDPYDTYIGDFSAHRRRRWSRQVLKELETAGLMGCSRWLILAGKKYREFLAPKLPGRVLIPLEGLGIGKQIAWLKDRLEPAPCRICKVAPATRPGELCAGCAQAVTARREARRERRLI